MTQIGRAVRRLHVPPGHRGKLLHCPDCNGVFLRIGERIVGTVLKQCRKCRDYAREARQYTIVFHPSVEAYTDAIKRESYSSICDDSALLSEQNLG